MAIVKTGKIYILYIYYTMLASPVLIVYMKLYICIGIFFSGKSVIIECNRDDLGPT